MLRLIVRRSGMGNSSNSFHQPYVPTPPPIQNLGGAEDRYGLSSSTNQASIGKPFKTKGMQLGAKGAKKQADLLETLGGAVGIDEEERASFTVYANAQRSHSNF